MTTTLWFVFASAFLASAVEFVEAFTIVLVVGVTVNWRSSLAGAAAAVGALAVIVGIFGTALVQFVPIEALRLVVGILLILFAVFLDDTTAVFVSELVAGIGLLVGVGLFTSGRRD